MEMGLGHVITMRDGTEKMTMLRARRPDL
jgi:hypothetical protein